MKKLLGHIITTIKLSSCFSQINVRVCIFYVANLGTIFRKHGTHEKPHRRFVSTSWQKNPMLINVTVFGQIKITHLVDYIGPDSRTFKKYLFDYLRYYIISQGNLSSENEKNNRSFIFRLRNAQTLESKSGCIHR